jgi:hypothetical protein
VRSHAGSLCGPGGVHACRRRRFEVLQVYCDEKIDGVASPKYLAPEDLQFLSEQLHRLGNDVVSCYGVDSKDG